MKKITGVRFYLSTLILSLFFLSACDNSKFTPTPIEQFVGTWELQGRSMFDGIKIEIQQTADGNLVGKLVELNSNKYVNMFASPGDTWVSSIDRSSNYQFSLTEKKLAAPLFSSYGLSTSNQFNVEFIDDNTIGLGSSSKSPIESSVKYVRVEQ